MKKATEKLQTNYKTSPEVTVKGFKM